MPPPSPAGKANRNHGPPKPDAKDRSGTFPFQLSEEKLNNGKEKGRLFIPYYRLPNQCFSAVPGIRLLAHEFIERRVEEQLGGEYRITNVIWNALRPTVVCFFPSLKEIESLQTRHPGDPGWALPPDMPTVMGLPPSTYNKPLSQAYTYVVVVPKEILASQDRYEQWRAKRWMEAAVLDRDGVPTRRVRITVGSEDTFSRVTITVSPIVDYPDPREWIPEVFEGSVDLPLPPLLASEEQRAMAPDWFRDWLFEQADARANINVEKKPTRWLQVEVLGDRAIFRWKTKPAKEIGQGARVTVSTTPLSPPQQSKSVGRVGDGNASPRSLSYASPPVRHLDSRKRRLDGSDRGESIASSLADEGPARKMARPEDITGANSNGTHPSTHPAPLSPFSSSPHPSGPPAPQSHTNHQDHPHENPHLSSSQFMSPSSTALPQPDPASVRATIDTLQAEGEDLWDQLKRWEEIAPEFPHMQGMFERHMNRTRVEIAGIERRVLELRGQL